MGMVRIGMGEWGRGESHSPCFYWGNIFVLNLIWVEFIWCESVIWGECDCGNVIWANVIWANAIRPYGEYNSSDCHLVGLFSLILPPLIVCVEFDCAEFDLGEFIWCECGCDECDWGECDSPLRISMIA